MNRKRLGEAVRGLCDRDPVFADVHRQWGEPPLWRRPASFRTLVMIIMEQKISLASARAVMQRLEDVCIPFTAARFLALDMDAVRAAGVSNAKIQYCRSIAEAMLRRQLMLTSLSALGDEAVIERLVQVHGIGPWTAGVYLTMVLCRQDAWASGDRALAVSVAEIWGLDDVPSYPELDERAQAWRPYRGAASRLLWHAYLSRRAVTVHSTSNTTLAKGPRKR